MCVDLMLDERAKAVITMLFCMLESNIDDAASGDKFSYTLSKCEVKPDAFHRYL